MTPHVVSPPHPTSLASQEGLKSYEVAISSQCAAALEHLAAFHFRTLTEEREAPAKAQLAAHLAVCRSRGSSTPRLPADQKISAPPQLQPRLNLRRRTHAFAPLAAGHRPSLRSSRRSWRCCCT